VNEEGAVAEDPRAALVDIFDAALPRVVK